MNIEMILTLIGLGTAGLLAVLAFLKNKELKTTSEKEIARFEKYNFYKNLVLTTIEKAVEATNQTFVDELKKHGGLTDEQKKEAFNNTYKAVKRVLTDEGIKVLNEFVKDVPYWIGEIIEATVQKNKK